MLRKRTRSHQKDQHMSHLMSDSVSESYFHSEVLSQKPKNNSFFNLPGLFVGLNPRSSDSDSVRSPTSPLDFRIFSSFGNPFRCPRSQNEGHQKSWFCSKVGLGIIDSLDDGETKQSQNVIRSSDSKNALFGRHMSVKSPDFCNNVSSIEIPKSLPKNVTFFPSNWGKRANVQKGNSDVLFEIGKAPFEPESSEIYRACSLDSGGYNRSHLTNYGNRKSRLGSGSLVPESSMNQIPSESRVLEGSLKLVDSSSEKTSSTLPSIHPKTDLIGSIPTSEIELSEDYTCVRTHGPNPKVTHIFGDCILESHKDEITVSSNEIEDVVAIPEVVVGPSDVLDSYPTMDFLKFCYSCHKELDGEDIYMYRGEKAFCSYSCRSQEIEIEEEMERTNNKSSEISDGCEEISERSLFITT